MWNTTGSRSGRQPSNSLGRGINAHPDFGNPRTRIRDGAKRGSGEFTTGSPTATTPLDFIAFLIPRRLFIVAVVVFVAVVPATTSSFGVVVIQDRSEDVSTVFGEALAGCLGGISGSGAGTED
jgi:hypothetical protein